MPSSFPSSTLYPSSTTFPHAKEPLPYGSIAVSYGTEFLYNRSVVSNIGDQPQTRENAASIVQYGVSSLELNGLLIATEEAANLIAGYLVNVYGEPELRIDSISIQLAGMFQYQQNQILSIELNDIIRVSFTPNNIGDPIAQELRVIGVSHSARPASHEVTLSLTAAGDINFVFGGSEDSTLYPFSIFAGDSFAGSPLGL